MSKGTIGAPPPGLPRLQSGSLYLHEHRRGEQTWMYVVPESSVSPPRANSDVNRPEEGGPNTMNSNRSASRRNRAGHWIKVRPGEPHPHLRGYVFAMRERGGRVPRYVMEQSAEQYAVANAERWDVLCDTDLNRSPSDSGSSD